MASISVADVPKPGFVPARQRAWRIVRKGEPPNALVLDNDAPVPTLKPGEVLVRVQAVSLHIVSVSSFLSLTERGLLTAPAEYTSSWLFFLIRS